MPELNQVVITSPAADPNHIAHWQLVLAAIVAAWQQAAPIVIQLLPHNAQVGVAAGTALAPVVIQTINQVQELESKQAQ